MAIKKILRIGHPILLKKALPVTEFNTPELDSLIEDMRDTMEENHGAGLAAPQIGISQQVVIFGVGANPRYPDAEVVPFTVLINPQITVLDDELSQSWEGCLSIPGMRGLVSRHHNIRYTGYDPSGEVIDRTVSGFHSVVVQHECDHLEGILYPHRIEDMRNFGYEEELAIEVDE